MSQDAPVARRQVKITNPYGLHLRPSEKFVGLAGQFRSEIRVRYQDHDYNGKSILDLMTLAAECGTALELEARGTDAEAAVTALAHLVSSGFHESMSSPPEPSTPHAAPPPSPTASSSPGSEPPRHGRECRPDVGPTGKPRS